MIDDVSAIQSRIQEIQSKLSTLTPQAPVEPGTQPDFQAQLRSAEQKEPDNTGGSSSPTETVVGGRAVYVPPASLGPLPPMSVSSVIPSAGDSQTTGNDYSSIVSQCAADNGIPPALVHAVIQTESNGNPNAVSSAGAMGLMQLMPSNVKDAGITNPFDPDQNIQAGTKQLANLMKQYNGDLDLTLAGYNAGPGAVRKYGGVPPFNETQNYIRKVRLAMSQFEAK